MGAELKNSPEKNGTKTQETKQARGEDDRRRRTGERSILPPTRGQFFLVLVYRVLEEKHTQGIQTKINNGPRIG